VACLGAPKLPPQSPISVSPLQFGPNEWRVPSQAVVISDMSGTTYVQETHPYIKAVTQSFVQAMPEGNTRAKYPGTYDATSIGFGGDERIISELAPFDRGALAAKADSLRLLGDLHGYGGLTPIGDVLLEVSEALVGKSGHAAVVLFSDGLPEPEEQTRAFQAAQMLIDSYNGDVCIHTVHFGQVEEGAEFLRKLADMTKCGSSSTQADVWSADGMMKFAHTVFAGPAEAAPDPCAGRIVLRGIEFEFDKSILTADSTVILDVAIDELNRCPNVPMQIEGHTDSWGSDAYNQALGSRRAGAVKKYFVSKGLRSGRLSTRSYGESRPVATNETDEGRQLNRRVELLPQQ
jgi:outer membrane protein OmpA-like peptidoglycan-associated protein